MPKKIKKSKKVKGFRKVRKKSQKVSFKIKPLELTKKVKGLQPARHPPARGGPLKPTKLAKPLPRRRISTRFSFRKPNIAKRVEIPLRSLVKKTKPRSENLTTPPLKKRRAKLPKAVKFLLRGKPPHQKFGGGGKPIEPPIYPHTKRGQGAKGTKINKVSPRYGVGVYKTRIKVIGIGGGGSSIVSEIASQVKKVGFVVANTDSQALQEATKEAKRFQFGKSITQGLGTGMNPELGEQAAESEKDKIKEILKETDFCVLVSCLGGGTSSGAAPVFAEILKKLGILTLGICTLPFKFEGGKRTQIAKDSLEKLRKNVNALVIIPNQKIFQIIDQNTPLKEAFSTINKTLIESLEGLITFIHSPGLINVSFADLRTILAGRGRLAYLNTIQTEDLNQVEEVAKRLLSNPLFPYSIQGAKEILFNIDRGLNLSLSQFEQISKVISALINPQARVGFGITQNKKEGIKITLIANGCKWAEWEKEKEKPEKESKEKPTLIAKAQDYNPPATLPLSRAPKPEKKVRTPTLPPPSRSLRERAPKPERMPEVPQSETPQTFIKEGPKEVNPIRGQRGLVEVQRQQTSNGVKIKVRQNALEVRKTLEEEEKKMLAQERKWETPAFLRHKPEEKEEPQK